MKKAAGLMAFIMTAVLMLSLCSCSSDVSPVETTTESSTESSAESPAEVSTEAPTVSSSDDGFSDDVTGSVMQLMYDVIGEDQATAEKMVGEFFNVEPVDSLGNIMTDERNGIVTVMHVYTDMFVKDSVRFIRGLHKIPQ